MGTITVRVVWRQTTRNWIRTLSARASTATQMLPNLARVTVDCTLARSALRAQKKSPSTFQKGAPLTSGSATDHTTTTADERRHQLISHKERNLKLGFKRECRPC